MKRLPLLKDEAMAAGKGESKAAGKGEIRAACKDPNSRVLHSAGSASRMRSARGPRSKCTPPESHFFHSYFLLCTSGALAAIAAIAGRSVQTSYAPRLELRVRNYPDACGVN